ncbi:MAG: hypothetical protein R3Y64_10140, partial [Peptostreptococcaceae bacterium]
RGKLMFFNNKLENKKNSNMFENLLMVDSNKTIKSNLKEAIKNEFTKSLIQIDDKNKYFKQCFKNYQDVINSTETNVLDNIHRILSHQVVERVILTFKYKENMDYKDKLKLIKECDVEYVELIIFEKYLNSVRFSVKNKLLNIREEDEHRVISQILIYKKTIEIIKLIKFDLYRKEFDYTDCDGKNKFKLLSSNRKIFSNSELVGTVLRPDRINKFVDTFIDRIYIQTTETALFLAACLDNDSFYNYEYERILLGEKFNEFVTKDNDIHIELFDSAIVSLYNDDLFKRKILLPKTGVIILPLNHDSVESILIKEIETNVFNNLLFITRYKNKKEVVNSVMLSNSYIEPFRLDNSELNSDIKSFELIYDFFKIKENDNFRYEVISPKYWKYRHKNYVSSSDVYLNNKLVKREFDVEVSSYIRKINGKCSGEALELSKRLGVVLEDGYTIVKAHKRTYNKIK